MEEQGVIMSFQVPARMMEKARIGHENHRSLLDLLQDSLGRGPRQIKKEEQ